MIEATIDCTGISGRAQLHQALAQALDFPAWYGNNLDALYDCLTERSVDTRITLYHWSALEASLGRYAAAARSVLLQAMMNNPHLTVRFSDSTPE